MDKELRYQILRAITRDRTFLKQAWRDVSADDFPEREEQIIATAALNFYSKYDEPIGGLLRTETDELANGGGFHLGNEQKKKLIALLATLSAKTDLVSVKALSERVRKLHLNAFYEGAVDQIIEAQEGGTFDVQFLEQLIANAKTTAQGEHIVSSNYKAEIKERIARRALNKDRKFPLLMIPPLDAKIKAIGRGNTGLFLAPYSSGKGMALVHVGISYMFQGLKGLHITLEDPKDEVEGRYDAALSGIALNRLTAMPIKLRKRFQKMLKKLPGEIRVIDGREGGWTVGTVERAIEQHHRMGYTPDFVIVDYDEYLECEQKFKGDNVTRFEMRHMYQRMNQAAERHDVIWWTAAQGTRGAEGKKIVTGKDSAEDLNKIRKVFLAIGIGSDKEDDKLKWLYVCRHRLDRSRFAVRVMTDFDHAIFCDLDATKRMMAKRRSVGDDD